MDSLVDCEDDRGQNARRLGIHAHQAEMVKVPNEFRTVSKSKAIAPEEPKFSFLFSSFPFPHDIYLSYHWKVATEYTAMDNAMHDKAFLRLKRPA
jgi:hypothetical protein